jgi:putative membrane protein insertion efficiency factor
MIISRILIFLIRIYRFLLSPYIGCHCRFFTNCYEYSQKAKSNFGPLEGLNLTIKRLCRCHPWHQGGFDPIPNFNK